MIQFRPYAKYHVDASIVFIDEAQIQSKKFNALRNNDVRNALIELSKAKKFNGSKNEIFPLFINKKIVLLTGIGKSDEITTTSLRISVRNAIQSSYLKKSKNIELIPSNQKDSTIKA
ncbi:MAG: hypothetical protein KAR20_28230, partial [Candidatus Heimdallarchaeota archaeon]|nr:hypothetical protein [Candidatus Heimdallarchaeota archaeon]